MDLLYPNLCLHCTDELDHQNKVLCQTCFDELSFTVVQEHCRRCYTSVEEEGEHPYCNKCVKKTSPFYRVLAPLEIVGPSCSLQVKLKHFTTAFLSRGLSAFITLYFIEQKLNPPDLIIPMPDPIFKKIAKGANPSYGIAKSLSQIWGVPILKALSESNWTESGSYSLKKSIEGKNVLLVGEILNRDFFSAGVALIEGFPRSIMGAALFKGYD